MTQREALSWLKQVGGTVFHNAQSIDIEDAWIAVVNTPAGNGTNSKIIVAFGESIRTATHAAEEQWNQVWSLLSDLH